MTYDELDREFFDPEFKNWLKERLPEESLRWTDSLMIHLLSLAFNARNKPAPPPTVWTLGYMDELTTVDCGEPLLAVIGVFANRQAAIDYVRNSADLDVDNEEQTSPVEYRMSGDALGSGRFLIVLREEVVK